MTSYTRQDIIKDAMYLCGALSFADEPAPEDQEMAERAFNVYVRSIMSKAPNLWRQTEGILFLEVGKAQYALGTDHACAADVYAETTITADAVLGATSLTVASIEGIADGDAISVKLDDGTRQWTTVNGTPSGVTVNIDDALTDSATSGAKVYSYSTILPRPVRITDSWRRVGTIDVPVPLVSRQEYFEQPNKTARGKIVLGYYSPELSAGKLYIWPTPNDVDDQYRFTYERDFADLDENEDIPDFPPEWTEAITYGLALRMAPRFGLTGSKFAELKIEADQKEAELLAFDQEYASIRFEPARM